MFRSTVILTLLGLSACATAEEEAAALFDDPASADQLGLAEDLSFEALAALPGIEQVGALADLRVSRVQIDELSMAHTRVQQTVGGVPVLGGEAIVHLHADGRVRHVTDSLLRGVAVDTAPDYAAAEAIDLAVEAWGGGWESLTEDPAASLWIVRQDGVDYLAYAVQLARLDGTEATSRPLLFVDAHTGEVVLQYDNLKTGTGTSSYEGAVSFSSYLSSGSYYLEDTARNLGTYTFNNTTSSLYYITDADDSFTDASQREGVDAHYAGAQVWDYYSAVHGRDGLDGAGGPGYLAALDGGGANISLLVNYGTNYTNAGWTGTYMLFGDGDGVSYSPLTTLDITGHEMTHGVNENTANFVYSYESGALDESWADVFGALVERYESGAVALDPLIGEDCYTPATGGDALRYMNNPTADGSSRDHYSSRYTGSLDNGGVHWNSGIGNLAFYLLAQGGAHPRLGGAAAPGIGADDAADIWYRAVAVYMTSSTNFAGARTATLAAAADLFGATSAQYASVQDAWAAVGVGSSSASACSGYTSSYTGSLSGTGSAAYQPSSSGFSANAGTIKGFLDVPAGADFDLYLYKKKGKSWSVAASSTGAGDQTVSYAAAKGDYVWYVLSASGGGSYELCMTKP